VLGKGLAVGAATRLPSITLRPSGRRAVARSAQLMVDMVDIL
jgi:hypothetical protein